MAELLLLPAGIQVQDGGHQMSLHTEQYLSKENNPPPGGNKTENSTQIRSYWSFFEVRKVILEETELLKYLIRVVGRILSKISELMWLQEPVFKELTPGAVAIAGVAVLAITIAGAVSGAFIVGLEAVVEARTSNEETQWVSIGCSRICKYFIMQNSILY